VNWCLNSQANRATILLEKVIIQKLHSKTLTDQFSFEGLGQQKSETVRYGFGFVFVLMTLKEHTASDLFTHTATLCQIIGC
jgi:hypothetical protein